MDKLNKETRNKFLMRGVDITHTKVDKAIRVEVDTEAFDNDPIYDDITLDSEMAIYYDKQYKNILQTI